MKTTSPESSRQPRRRGRVLAGWIAASVIAHALVLLGMPQSSERAPRVEILRVEIEQAPTPAEIVPPPRAAKAEPRPKPIAPDKPRPVPAKPLSVPAPQREPAPPPPREILALPREPAQPEPLLTVPAPEARGSPKLEPPRAARPGPPLEATAAPKPPPPPPRIADARVIESPVRYPRTAEQGRVTLKVLVSRDGRVAKATLEKTSGYANLDQHALQAVRGWRFAPARQGSEPVEQWLTVNVDY